MRKFISLIIILSLLYSNSVFALTKTSEFESPDFNGLIKPLAVVSSLFSKRDVSMQDLLLVKASLIQLFKLEGVDVTLGYNKKNGELFLYSREEFFHIWMYGKTSLPGPGVQHEVVGRINISRYEFVKELEGTIAEIRDKIILAPEEKTLAPPAPKRLQYPWYPRIRFWLSIVVLSIGTPLGLLIYGTYSVGELIVDTVQKRRLTEEGYERWLERRRHWLLGLPIVIPMLKLLPLLRVELRDIIQKAPPSIWAGSENYSSKRIPDNEVLGIIHLRHKIVPKDKEWEGIKAGLRTILEELGERDLLRTLDTTTIYLVEPGADVNSPFLHYDRKTNSYLFTYIAGEPQIDITLSGRWRRFVTRGGVQYLQPGGLQRKGAPNVYISRVFYEQLSRQKPLVTMLLAETIVQLASAHPEILDKIRARIGKTRPTLNEAKTLIKNAYFYREREPSPAEWSKGVIRTGIRNKIIQVITWSQQFFGWAHFMKAFISEFFTITQNWIRTPFIYPLRSNPHCGIPTPDTPLPEYGTYLWAIQLGFSDEAARIIGEADICTDKITSGYIPRIGDQSRHYNMYLHDSRWRRLRETVSHDITQLETFYYGTETDKSIRENYTPNPQFETSTDIELLDNKDWSGENYPDTRLDWAQYELERAEYFYHIGDKRLALECLGRGLHSLQDLVAHRDFEVGPFGTKIHPPELDDPDYDPDPTGKLVPSTERRRIKETERLTKAYLELARQRFLRRYYPRHGYFEMQKDGLTSRYYTSGPKKGSVDTQLGDDWVRENVSFTYTKIIFKNGLHTRPSTTIAYAARILHALTGINTAISRVDKHPFPSEPADASSPLEELTLKVPYNSEIMVTVGGDIPKEFLDRALDIIVNEVLETEIFNDIGLEPSDEEEKRHPDLFYRALHKKERILYLINSLALDIKKALEDKRPLAEEAQAQKTLKDTYININNAIAHGITDEDQRDRIAPYVYFLLRRLDEIREGISTRPIRPLTASVPREPDKILPFYTREFLEYAVLAGLIADPLKWYEQLSRLRDDLILSPLRLQSFKTWLEIVEYVKNENPGLSITGLKEKVTDCYYETYGDIAARKLGGVELSIDIIAGGINTFPPLREELGSLLPRADHEDLHNYLTNIYQKQLPATRVVGLGLLTQGGVRPELRTLLLGEAPEDLIDRLGIGETIASLEETYPDRFRTANSWQRIYEYVQALTEIGKKPKRILVDLDMTVFTPIGYLGSYPWFDQRIKETNRHQTFWEWGDHERRMEQHGFFRLVDPQIAEIIERLKSQGIEVVGFTARMWKKDSRRTKSILSRLGIRFSKIAFVPGIYQYGGVVYTFGQGVHKSKAFERLTKERDSEVTVIIDDTLTNVANILKNTASAQTYGVLYHSPAKEPLLTLKAPDYIKLGDTATTQGQFDFAEEYYMNAVEQARYLDPPQKPDMFRKIWQRVTKLAISGKDTEGLVRFLIQHDDSKEDLRIMDRRLKDPYLNLLTIIKLQPITDRERPRVLVYKINESTDLLSLKNILRTVRSIRREDGSPKFRTVLTSHVPAIKIRQRIKKQGIEEGIDYDYWQVPKSLTDSDIITISSDTPQSTYEAIASAEGYTAPIPAYTEKSPFSNIELVSLREEARRLIETGGPIPSGNTRYEIALKCEILRQTKGLTSAALYLEEASQLPQATPRETDDERALLRSV